MRFHERFADLDALLFDELGDPAHFEGRAEPVLGSLPPHGRLRAWVPRRFHCVSRGSPFWPAMRRAWRSGRESSWISPPDGGAYIVVRREPDGTGLVALLLRRD